MNGHRTTGVARSIAAVAAMLCAGAMLLVAYAPRAEPGAGPATPQVDALPAIQSTAPMAEATGVSGRDPLVVQFTTPMAPASLTSRTITLIGPTGAELVGVQPLEQGRRVVIRPGRELLPASRYTLFLQGVTDLARRPLPLSVVGFDTAARSAGSGAIASAGASAGGSGGALPSAAGAPARDIDAQLARLTADERQAVQQAGRGTDPEDWQPGPEQFHGRWRADRADSPLQALPPLQAASGVTALSGQVLGLSGHAVPGVTLRIADHEARTDVTGRFLLRDLPPGFAKLEIDGVTADRADAQYGYYAARIELKPGQTTTVPYVIWMPRLDPAGTVHIASPTTAETIIASPRIPGLELHIPAGTVIRDREGQIVTEINVTAIPVDRPPFPVPDLGVPTYFTVQPGGAILQSATGKPSPGARLFYPNFRHEVPGARGTFWNYDPEDRGWFVYGMGTISRDGKQAIPDDGVVIHEFTGAMFNGGGTPGPIGGPPCPAESCCTGDGTGPGGTSTADDSGGSCPLGGDPVNLVTGQFDHTEHDLTLEDVIPIDIARTYNSSDKNLRSFGVGMTHAYDVFFFSQNQFQVVDLILPNATRVHYIRTTPGNGTSDAVFESTAPGQWSHSIITPSTTRIGWDLRFRDGRTWFFPQTHPLTEVSDASGNVIHILREGGGRVLRLTSQNGRTVDFTYTGAGLVSAVTDNLGRSVTYGYDGSGRLLTVTDPGGGTRQYTWDVANNRITAIHDANGNLVVQNQYDSAGRVQNQTLGDGHHFGFAYTTLNGATTQTDLTDQRGTVRRVQFNAAGYIVQNTFALGLPEQQLTTYEIGSNGRINARVDPLNRRTEYQYDAAGNTTQITALAGTGSAVSTTTTYDSVFSQPLTTADPNGHTTTRTYDDKGKLLSMADALGQATTFSYDSQGRQLTRTDPLGKVTTLAYDGPDVSSATDALGRQVQYLTDVVGRTIATADPLGNRVMYDWDDMDRQIGMTDALGGATSFSYDPNGNVLGQTDAKGHTTSYVYNALNKVQSMQDALSRSETRQYDPAGLISQVVDRKGQLRSVIYDALGRVKTVGFGATAANPAAYTSQIENTWDAGNRLTQITEKICADPISHPNCGGIASTRGITRGYDTLDRLISEITPQGEVDYAYDAAGRRTSMTIKNGAPGSQITQPAITYSYDNADRMTGIHQAAGSINQGQAQDITLSYDATGRRTQVALANGSTATYTYDDAGQLISIVYKKADGSVIGDLQYSYDAAGRRSSVAGSLARLGLPDTEITEASYDANNRLLTWAGKSYIYDDNGNLIGDGVNAYQWNDRDRLASIHAGGSEIASFEYDSRGRRTGRTIGPVTTGFLYDDVNIAQELQGIVNTAPVKAHLLTSGIDEVFLRLEGNDGASRHTLLADANNNTVMLLDAAQASVVNYSYEPYGTTMVDATQANAQQYTGRENENVGIGQDLYYYRARYYMPGIARFLSEDPIGWASGQTNNYAYVRGDPISLRDPSGLDSMDPDVAGPDNSKPKKPPPPPREQCHGLGYDHEECAACCYRNYDRVDGERCRRLKKPLAKALCWQAATGILSVCYGLCPPSPRVEPLITAN